MIPKWLYLMILNLIFVFAFLIEINIEIFDHFILLLLF